jgi:glycosyltransferase involved in cell wall biosynthesis
MKLAYFAPLPPKRTGVADYALHLARALAPHADIAFFDGGAVDAPNPGNPVIDYVQRPEALLRLPDYDAVLYQLGNNPEFHAPIFNAFLFYPGPVVLHDTVLYFLMAGLHPGGFLREFLYNHGPGRLDEFFAIPGQSPARSPLQFPYPERYPLLRRVLAQAPAIVVHSKTSADLLGRLGYRGAIEVIPLLAFPLTGAPDDAKSRAAIRGALGLGPGELLLGSFGFIGPTKRFPAILAALSRLRPEFRFKLLIVGEGREIADDIEAAGMREHVILMGFVDAGAFADMMRAIDILLNLRFPSMGETSSTQVQAMAAGIPTIVSDDAWFSELPDETVRKVKIGADEEESLVEALREMAGDASARRSIGAAAQAWAAEHFAADKVAARYAALLKHSGANRPASFYPPVPPDGGPQISPACNVVE